MKHNNVNRIFCLVALFTLILLGPKNSLASGLFEFKAEVIKIEDLTHNVRRVGLRLKNSKGFTFTPGQYTFVRIPKSFVKKWNQQYKTSHDEVFRPYSFASSSSHLPLFDLIIKLARAPRGKDVPPGIASTFIHSHLKVGDRLELSAPTGDLYLKPDTGEPIIIVAGGSGAAPFVSLLQYFFEKDFHKNNEIYFFFGVRSKRDLFLHDQFVAWDQSKPKFHYIPGLSRPQPEDNWKGETGYIQLALDKHLKGPSGAHAYLAGPPIMIREVEKVLRRKGITKNRTHYDEIEAR